MFSVVKSNRAASVAALVTVVALTATVVRLHAGVNRGVDSQDADALAAAAPAGGALSQSPGADPDRRTLFTGSGTGDPSAGVTPTPGANTPVPSPCGHASYTFTLSTDKAAYQSGDTVWVTLTAKFKGITGCAKPRECIPFVLVANSDHQQIATTMTPPRCGIFPPLTITKDTTLQERYPWNQQPLNAAGTATTGQEVPRGTYTLTADWHSLGLSPSVTIQLAT